MTALTAATPPLLRRHTGRRRKTRTTVHPAIQVVMIAVFGAVTAGFLMAAGQQLPRQQPRCVRWHSCACRFPGQGGRWPGHNQLCAINWEPAPRALPHGGGVQR